MKIRKIRPSFEGTLYQTFSRCFSWPLPAVSVNILKISFPQKAHPISLVIKLMGLRINPLLWIMHHMRSYIGWVSSLSEVNSAQKRCPPTLQNPAQSHWAECVTAEHSRHGFSSGGCSSWMFHTGQVNCSSNNQLFVGTRHHSQIQPALPWLWGRAGKHSISQLPAGLCLVLC